MQRKHLYFDQSASWTRKGITLFLHIFKDGDWRYIQVMVKISTKRCWQSLLIVVMAIGVALLSTSGAAFADPNPNPNVFSPTAPVFGKTYAQWSALWWQRQFAITPKQFATDCRVKQSGPVFFFDGAGAPTNCTIPAGKAILFPVVTYEQDVLSLPCFPPKNPLFPPIFPPGSSDTTLRNCVIADINYVTALRAEFDGKALHDLMTATYLVISPAFDFTAIKNNAEGATPGKNRGVSDGIWIILKPLSPGVHHLHIFAKVVQPQPVGTFLKDVTYTITIKP
jgi:hypothetical protein